MSITEKLQIIAENEQKVFKAGRNSAVDPDKIIKATATGVYSVYLNDVSEAKHDVKVKTIARANVKVMGKNVLPYPYRYSTKTIHDVTFTDNGDGTISVKGTATGNVQYDLLNAEIEAVENLLLSGSPTGGSGETYCLQAECRTPEGKYVFPTDIGKGATIIKGYTITRIFIITKPAAGTVDFIFKPQLEKNKAQTSYEPYSGAEYTADTNGNVTIVSRSPIMEIRSDGELSVEYHRSFGMQTEYDRFWGKYQDYGNRTNYDRAFAGVGWTDETFKPKYKINIGYSAYMTFANTMLSEITRENVDFSMTASYNYTFYYNNIFKKVEIDCSSAATLNDVFDLYVMESIKLYNMNGNAVFRRTFGTRKCPSLTTLIISGVIAQNGFDIKHLENLSKESLLSIINCLEDKTSDTSGTEWIVTLGEINIAKLTDEEKQIAWSKGWVLG